MKPKDAKTYTAGDWLPFYTLADVDKNGLAEAKSGHAKAVLVGQFLSPNVGREVPIRVGGRTGRARLMVREGRSRAKHYFFAVVWDEVEPATEDTKADPPASEAKGARPKTKPAGTSSAVSATKPTAGRTQVKPPRPKPGTPSASDAATTHPATCSPSPSDPRPRDESPSRTTSSGSTSSRLPGTAGTLPTGPHPRSTPS